jgi:putative Ca2+/H+ antiporter (TMEM165/GDT1 family)
VTAFWIAFLLVFIAEMGDKTQLVALAFATRFKPLVVMAGVFVATLLIHLFSVALGEMGGAALPTFWINIIAGTAFIGFGLWTIRGDELDDDDDQKTGRRFGPFLTVGVTFFIAELGDKTMLATVTIASQQNSFAAVWIGSTLGMVLADGLAIVVGKIMGRTLPAGLIKWGAATIFILSGLVSIVKAFRP